MVVSKFGRIVSMVVFLAQSGSKYGTIGIDLIGKVVSASSLRIFSDEIR